MSTLSSLRSAINGQIAPLLNILLPHYCIVCGCRIADRSRKICGKCLCDMPLTFFSQIPENPMTQHANDKLEQVVHASAMIHYSTQDRWRKVIHRLKYYGQHHLGTTMGNMLGQELMKSEIYDDIDLVVAIPLHPFRRISRGYNQSHYIARAVAKQLGKPYRSDLLKRCRYNTSQVKIERSRRWENTKDLFRASNPEMFESKSVLIIDDVFTTGATTISCAKSIVAIAPNCRIYIATIALSGSRFGF